MGNDIYRNSGTTNLPTWIATDYREKDSTETGPLLLNYCMTGRCKIILNNGNFAYVKDGEISLTEHFAKQQYIYPRRIYEGLEFSCIKNLLPLLSVQPATVLRMSPDRTFSFH